MCTKQKEILANLSSREDIIKYLEKNYLYVGGNLKKTFRSLLLITINIGKTIRKVNVIDLTKRLQNLVTIKVIKRYTGKIRVTSNVIMQLKIP